MPSLRGSQDDLKLLIKLPTPETSKDYYDHFTDVCCCFLQKAGVLPAGGVSKKPCTQGSGSLANSYPDKTLIWVAAESRTLQQVINFEAEGKGSLRGIYTAENITHIHFPDFRNCNFWVKDKHQETAQALAAEPEQSQQT